MKTLVGTALVFALALVTPLLALADDAAVQVKQEKAKTTAPKEEIKIETPKDAAVQVKQDEPEKTAAKEESKTETHNDADKEKEKHTNKGDKVKPYPLKTCLVTDNDLKSMGDPVTIVHEGQEIKFCCAPCEKKFLKDPKKYLDKLAKATEEK
jgi:hypothetical protein